MWAFLAAVIAVVGIGYGASVALDTYQRTSDTAYTTTGARPDPEVGLKNGKFHAPDDHKG
jgi:hypothetical protein